MARKSRKQPKYTLPLPIRETVGYIRLSYIGKDGENSIENQKTIIEDWGNDNKTPISRWYIDNGYSGKTFQRPEFMKMIQAVERGEIECVVVKDLSRLGRNHIDVGYYLEFYFPQKKVRFVSVNDHFDTLDGINDQHHPQRMSIRIPIINLYNEQVSIDLKRKEEAALKMKAERGAFIGPRAPFGYKKSEDNHDQLIPDPIAAMTVKKIFDLAANGSGLTGIVRYLNEKKLPTPIQYARSNGLVGNYEDGSGDWNSRSVKYILTNRTYTGMLVQGKEKRMVRGTHEALVDEEIFDKIQREFQSRSFHVSATPTGNENIFKGKVICACCGGKMQRKRGTNQADWYFFTCITKNRLGADKCTGMYAREEDVLSAVYNQLKQYVKQHFLSSIQYRQEIKILDDRIALSAQVFEEAQKECMHQYERYIDGEGSVEEIKAARPARDEAKKELDLAVEAKKSYEEQYRIFYKLLKASNKEIPLEDILDCIDHIMVDTGKQIVVKWYST